MNTGWVASGVRGHSLAHRRLGLEDGRRLAAEGSLADALDALAPTAYGREVRRGMALGAAQHALWATALWHLRVLAGWGPPFGAGALRALAGRFEIANVIVHLDRLAGRDGRPTFALGALATTWPAVSRARSAEEVRRVLAVSPWGDPGSADVASVTVALQLGWARRLATETPGALEWATAWAGVLLARALAAGAVGDLGPAARRDVRLVLGPRPERAGNLTALRAELPRSSRWVLQDISEAGRLWLAEARWWQRVEEDGARLARGRRPGVETAVGVAGLLLADAWRVSGALELAARGGGQLLEMFDAVA